MRTLLSALGESEEEGEMILMFKLVQLEAASDERLLTLIHRARQIALEIDGVYDLALYQKRGTKDDGVWQCNIDVEDERTWELLQADLRFREVCAAVKRLGVEITLESRLERQI